MKAHRGRRRLNSYEIFFLAFFIEVIYNLNGLNNRKAEVMNRKYLVWPVLVSIIIFIISGCGTVLKKFKEEVGGIKTRVETLESRVEGVEAKQSDAERAAAEQAEALDR